MKPQVFKFIKYNFNQKTGVFKMDYAVGDFKFQERYDELKNYINQLLHSYEEVDWNFGVNVEALG